MLATFLAKNTGTKAANCLSSFSLLLILQWIAGAMLSEKQIILHTSTSEGCHGINILKCSNGSWICNKFCD